MAETRPALPLDVMEIGERAAQFARSSRARATERADQSDWSDFVGWYRQAGVALNRRVAAITAAHRMAGQGFDASHPAIANVLAGIRRAYGTRQDAKTALLTKVEHDRLFGQSVSHQLFSSDGKRCTLCLGVADRLDLEFRWPSGPNSRSGSSGARSININSVVEDPFGGVGAQHEDAIEARLLGQFAGVDLEGRAGLAIPAADGAMHHALVALGFRELPRNPDGAVGGEAMMGTLKAALRAPARGNKGLINFLNRRAGRGCRVRRHGGSLRVVSVPRQRLSAAAR